MKKVMKVALGALMLAGVAGAAVTPASAAVSVGIGVGAPGYYGPYPNYSCDPYSRWYAPAYCGPGYYGYGPSFVIGGHFGGGWHGGGFHGGGFHGGGHR